MGSIILIILFTFIEAWRDFEVLNSTYIFSHVSRWIARAFFVLAVAQGDFSDIIGMTLIFSALFDSVLNRLRGKDIFYLGTVAYWDRFWSKIPYLYVIFKIVSLLVGVYLCLI